jgi:hypothetical protein
MAIGTVEFDLSMVNPNTGEYLTAKAYTVAGVTNPDGSLRQLSIGQLVMAICLQRASDLENRIIEKMSALEQTTNLLQDLTAIEQDVVNEFSNNQSGHAYELEGKYTPSGTSYLTLLRSTDIGVMNGTQHYVRNDSVQSNQDILYSDFATSLEAKMDERNSFSQQTMIELQSLTSKRDQSYDMISNILKSLNTVLVGNVNNF